MVGMVVLSSVTKMKTAKFTDIMPSSVRFGFSIFALLIWNHILIDIFEIPFPYDAIKKQCPAMEPFDNNDHELEQNYAEVLRMNTVDVMDNIGEEGTEMEKALNEYAQIGTNLGIIPTQCKYFAGDPCWLSRWLVGDDKIPKVI